SCDPVRPVPWPDRIIPAPGSDDDDLCPNRDPVVKINDVFVAHPDASGRDRATDCVGLIGAMDAIKCRAEIEGARAHRILRPALHVDGENAAFLLLSRDHFCWRSPIGPFGFACHFMGASPLKAGLARTNAVAP